MSNLEEAATPWLDRNVVVYDTYLGSGRMVVASILEELGRYHLRLRLWSGHPTPTGWQPDSSLDGKIVVTTRAALLGPRTLTLYSK